MELKMMLNDQKSRVNQLQNRPLMTTKMREREEMLKQQKHPKTMIRVRFPDRFVLEATFLSRDSGILYLQVSKLIKVLEKYVTAVGEIRLYVAPPQQFLDPEKSFWEQNLSPASVVHLQGNGVLSDASLSLALDYPIDIANEEFEGENSHSEPLPESENVGEQKVQSNSLPAPPVKSETKLPKWLRLK
jgi:tether containing UBX domain for GLUT4